MFSRFVTPLLLTLTLLFGLTACGTTNIQIEPDGDYNNITVTMSAEDAANMLEGLLTAGDPPLLRTADVELRDGYVFVQGTVRDENGRSYNGTLSLRIWAQNGDLQMAVDRFNFAGYTADAGTLQEINEGLARGFADAAARDDSGSSWTRVVIDPNQLSFTLRVPARDN